MNTDPFILQSEIDYRRDLMMVSRRNPKRPHGPRLLGRISRGRGR